MANEIRLRSNNQQGTITDNPLTSIATTINSAGFVSLPTVDATNHLIIILDPLETAGQAEIVTVTTHTAAASVITVVRGAEGSVARAHLSGTTWFHGPVAGDFLLSDQTSISRPAAPYRGELIFEADTNSYVGRATSDVWQTVMPLGGWSTWVPVGTQLNTPAQTLNLGRFTRHGRLITATFSITFNGAGTAANGIRVNLPVTAAVVEVGGTFRYFDTGTTNHAGSIIAATVNAAAFVYDGFGNEMGNGDFTIAAGDFIHGTMVYEAAA